MNISEYGTKVDDSNFDDCVAFLCEVFENLDVDTITLYLLKSKDVTEALNRLKSFVIEKESQLIGNGPKVDGLQDLFPECEPDYIYSFISAHQDLDLFELSDLMVKQLVSIRPKPKQKPKFIPLKDFEPSQSDISDNYEQSSFNRSTQFSINNHPQKISRSSNFPFIFDFGCEKPEETYEYYRSLVDELNIERSELFEKAAKAFTLSNLEGYSSAAFYSQKARDINAEIKNFKALAASAAFSHNNTDPFSNKLDLHGLTVQEALPLTSAFLQHHLIDYNSKEALIITGRGARSKNGIRLKPAIYHLLKDQHWVFNLKNDSTFVVYRKNKI
jgi:Smr domain/Domain of unknown function (DUF1771)